MAAEEILRIVNTAPASFEFKLNLSRCAHAINPWRRAAGARKSRYRRALAGFDDRPLAPIMSRVGRLLFDRGEEIYNFQGVRRYKDKYDPPWQPRYIAAPNRWAIPLALADVGLMSSGGMAGLVARRKRAEEGAGG